MPHPLALLRREGAAIFQERLTPLLTPLCKLAVALLAHRFRCLFPICFFVVFRLLLSNYHGYTTPDACLIRRTDGKIDDKPANQLY